MSPVDSRMQRLVLDMDVGIDDALAILYLAAQPSVEIVAVGAVHGNCRADAAAQNALRALEACHLMDVPVALGESRPLAQELQLAEDAHGYDGLGNARLPLPEARPTAERAADQIVRLANERPGELDLLATGPLTNLAVAVQQDPRVLARYRQVVLMGGSGPYPSPGTILDMDMNVSYDPHAADIVFAAERQRLVMVGANVTTPTVIEEHDLALIDRSDTPQADFARRILPYYVDFYEQKWARRVASMHDPLAAGIAVDPTLIRTHADGPVKVVPTGDLHRAMLLDHGLRPPVSSAAFARPATHVVTAVDTRGFIDRFVAALVEPLPARSARRCEPHVSTT